MKDVTDISNLVSALRVHQIRSGKAHRFVDISIVETQGRFFVRLYKFGKNSWYSAFLKEPNGEIKCGETIISIKGVKPQDLDKINKSVTRAFWKKYHLNYGLMKLGFNTKNHEASTLELIPQV
ncbi:hypothetical protein N480_19585 [Pseudoalteromonas luteoviolacea S2607]|uniref:DUF2255 family protein n=1 Tax=Pseudoalteromonas luteoviolacea TaxID=43657 RepID=UPI0007B03D14|nr:DUF2255 family protein [Pseudoalteromonas luteoviolacea]KZN35248.1 hypothetical protein N480_19585 [Pseudoalteromonas luteoviolacea S2607]